MNGSKRLRVVEFAVLLVAVSLLLPACQAPSPETDDQTDQQDSTSFAQDEQGDETTQPTWEKRLKESGEKEFSGEKAAKLVELGRQHFQNGEYEQAKQELQEALSLQPGHQEAQNLLRNVLVQLGELEQDFESGENLLKKWESVGEQHQHKAQVAFKEGKQAYENEKYDEAVTKFEEVLSRIRFMPLSRPEMKNLKEKTKEFLVDARKKRKKQQELREQKKRRAMQKMAQQEELRHRKNRKQRIREILNRARELFEKKEYEKVESLLEEAEKIDPTIEEIHELKRIAWRMRHRKKRRDLARRSKKEYRQTMRDVKEQLVSQSKIVKYPEEEEWKDIKSREPKGIRKGEEKRKECERDIISQLESVQVTVNFQNASLPSVIEFFRKRTNVNMIIDNNNVQQAESIEVSLQVREIEAIRALNLILEMKDLAYVFQECVMVITQREVKEEPVFEMYEIKDLNLRLKNFPGADINLPGATAEQQGGGGGPGGGGGLGVGGGGGGEDQQQAAFTGQQLVDLIQQVVSPESWNQAGNNIQATNGLLMVRNSPEVHDEVIKLLQNIRRSTGIIVTVESRFLEVRSTLLEQLGVEFSDLDSGPSLNEFSADSSVEEEPDFIGRDRDGSGTVTGADLTSGIFEDTTDADGDTERQVGARTSHEFGEIVDNAFQSIEYAPFLDNEGMNFQVSILNDVSVNAIINAVKKDSRSRQVIAPTLTLFNTQRGNVTVARQIAYIEDVDPQVSSGSVQPDPQPNIVNDNAFVLDVKPIVSADRRYITLELRPTVADLLGPVEDTGIEVLIGGSVADFGFTPVTATIEFPQIEVKKVRTTVAIPDGGTLMVGGLTSITDTKRDSKVPVLGDLPLIGFLGNKKQDVQDHFQLIILVTGNITIMEEVEKQRFSTTVDMGQAQ